MVIFEVYTIVYAVELVHLLPLLERGVRRWTVRLKSLKNRQSRARHARGKSRRAYLRPLYLLEFKR
jgi:hypothetical protein